MSTGQNDDDNVLVGYRGGETPGRKTCVHRKQKLLCVASLHVRNSGVMGRVYVTD